MTDFFSGMASHVKSMKDTVNLSITGNSGVWVRRWRRSTVWRYIGRRRVRVMKKLDLSKVEWIIREKRKNTASNREIAAKMNVSVRWVQKLHKRYKDADKIVYPAPMGRPKKSAPGRLEHSVILSAIANEIRGAATLERVIRSSVGMYIAHNFIHKVLKDADYVDASPNKSKRRKWVRWERTYSNSLWHTDFKHLDDGRWLICYQDDASRFVTGFGVFAEATTENALKVLDEAIKNHGKPASILTDRGTQFYATESEAKKKGASKFEQRLVELDIKHILARVRHPQTNGKLERLHGEIQRKLRHFEDASAGKTRRGTTENSSVGGPFYTASAKDPVERFMEWYNYNRPHMSLDWDNLETPVQAFKRKMPPAGKTVTDSQTGQEYSAE